MTENVERCPVCSGAKELRLEAGDEPEPCWGCDGQGTVPAGYGDAPAEAADAPVADPLACGVDGCGHVAASNDELVVHAMDHGVQKGLSVEDARNAAGGGSAQRPRRRRIEEGKPWQSANSDGALNLGSYEFGAAVAYVEWAYDLIVAERGRAPFPQVAGLAKRLLRIADRVQATMRPEYRVDRMAPSHQRCRGAVRTVLAAHPLPWGDADDADAWEDAMVADAVELLRVAVSLVDPDPSVDT